MSERKINLEEILNNTLEISKTDSLTTISRDSIIIAMKEACRQILELATENAEVEPMNGMYVLKQSILDTINQII